MDLPFVSVLSLKMALFGSAHDVHCDEQIDHDVKVRAIMLGDSLYLPHGLTMSIAMSRSITTSRYQNLVLGRTSAAKGAR